MSGTLVVVWLAAEATRQLHAPDLEAFARARGVALAEPATTASGLAPHDDALAATIEAKLEEARTAATLDEARAIGLLADVERALRDDPRLPQSAWLLAERWRIAAAIAERKEDGRARAVELHARADALEGERAPAFGGTELPVPAVATVRVSFHGGAPDEIFVDGAAVGTEASVRTGEHHVLVVRAGRTAWSGWLTVTAPGAVRLPMSGPAPCSADELDGIRAPADSVLGATAVTCPSWAVARPAIRGVEIATCRGAVCGAFHPWRRTDGAVYAGPPQPASPARSAPWLTLAIVGATTIAATALVAYASAGRDDEPRQPRRVYVGPSLGTLSF